MSKQIVKTKGLQLQPPVCSIQALEDYFHDKEILTTDANGLSAALKNMKFEEKQADKFAKDFFVVGDPDNYGWIDVEDFLGEYTRMLIFKAMRVLLSSLDTYDTDHDGEINADELKAVLDKMLGVEYSARKVFQILKAVDSDASGKMSESELQKWYTVEDAKIKKKRKLVKRENKRRTQCYKKTKPKTNHKVWKDLHLGTEISQEQLEEIWLKYDKDHSHTIDSKELQKIVKDLFNTLIDTVPLIMKPMLEGFGIEEKEIEAKIQETTAKFADADIKEVTKDFLAAMDSDNDGSVSKHEFFTTFNAALYAGTSGNRSPQHTVHLSPLK